MIFKADRVRQFTHRVVPNHALDTLTTLTTPWKGGLFYLCPRSSDVKEGDKLVTTQLPRAITGLLVDPIDASKFEEALAADAKTGGKSG